MNIERRPVKAVKVKYRMTIFLRQMFQEQVRLQNQVDQRKKFLM